MAAATFPGSFDPLTIAHLAIVDAVRATHGVDRVDLTISRQALEKEDGAHSPVEARAETIEAHRGDRPWIDVVVTDAQLLVDIAEGYDLLVLGADKWHQLHDPRFYGGSVTARDAALERLPRLAIVPRTGFTLPSAVEDSLLDVPVEFHAVSSTAVRDGRSEWRA